MAGEEARERLDVWLWRARFYKTRSLAAKAATAGAIRLERPGGAPRAEKPAAPVRVGDRLSCRMGDGVVRVVEVLALGVRRGPAVEARALYRDLAPPSAPARSPNAGPRPSKRDRRALDAFRGRDES